MASNEPIRIYGRVFFINTKDQENPVIKLEAEDGTDFRLKAEGLSPEGCRVRGNGLSCLRTWRPDRQDRAPC